MTDLALFRADLVGMVLASLLAVGLWFLPGLVLARGMARIAPAGGSWQPWAPALAFTLLPLLGSLAIRAGGVGLAAALHLVLAAAALVVARADLPRPGRAALGGIAAWWLYMTLIYVDVDLGRQLYQSLPIFDLVKHAIIVREIDAHGLPLRDPFFLRAEPAGYYHFFYGSAAVIDRLGGALVDARMAFCGLAFATGIALAATVRALAIESGLIDAAERGATRVIVLLCAIGGFDLFGVWLRWRLNGTILPNSERWDDEISLLPTSASWVPHHLSAVIAAFVALIALHRALGDRDRRARLALATLAGAAMAAAFGLSVWVTLGAAAALAAALLAVPREQRLAWIVLTTLAGVTALVLSVPQLAEVLQGRGEQPFPLGLWLRDHAKLGALTGQGLSPLAWLAGVPLIWLLEFGALAIGTWLFWRRADLPRRTTLERILVATAVTGLVLNLFVRSTIINNDFGWRVAWFAALPMMVWTLAVLLRPGLARGAKLALGVAIAFGLASTLFNLAGARFIRPPLLSTELTRLVADPPVDYGEALAYRWASDNLPPGAVLQHNPARAERVFNFGLYATQPVLVADRFAQLFGASPQEVRARTDGLGAVFAGKTPPERFPRVHYLVTLRDPLWLDLPADRCLYRSDTVCITRTFAP